MANSKPDGYTLLMALSSISIIPEADKLFDRKPAYTMDQLMPIALISADPTILVVRAEPPWKTVKEFVDDAKKRPGEISYSSSGVYGTLHMAMEMLTHAAGIKLKHVPYSGAGPALTAILGGHVDALASGPAVVIPHIKAGKLRPLAGWGDKRVAALPEVADLQGAGLRHRVLHLGRAVRAAGNAGAGDEKLRESVKRRWQRRIQDGHGQARDADRLPGRAGVPEVLGQGRQNAGGRDQARGQIRDTGSKVI